jgi:predicted N-acetyltransferase YhbS
MPCDVHTCKPLECYVDSLAVLPASRGLGVGTKLLEWAEDVGRERGCDRMTLGVLNGNPAERLYKRTGYARVEESCVDVCCMCFFITFLFGRPYGLCHKEWGGKMMEKELPPGGGGEMER